MPPTMRPASFPSAAPCRPSDRRERSAILPPALHGSVPVFERSDHQTHHPATPRPGDPPAAPVRLAQIVHLAATGIWVIKHNGLLLSIGNRMHWQDLDSLMAAAGGAGVEVSSIIVRTGAV